MAGMAGEHQYFYEDGVYRITKKGNVQFGMVLENSELVSGDESSDEDEGGRMKKGHIRVAWHPTGVEEVIPERKVKLADRSLMPGDVVRRLIKGKDTQRGYCRHIRVTSSVQVVGTKQVILNVESANLVPLEEFGVDIAACLDSWVGGIKTVHSKLTLKCNDGSRCIINDVDACGFENFTDKRDMDFEFPGHRDDFYPGQTLWGPVHVLEDAEWITCSKDMKANCSKPNKTVKVIVEDVQTDNVGIHWQCRAYSKDGASADKEQPKYLVQGDDLKRLRLLNVFEPCTLQVGDRNFYTFRDGDRVVSKEQWRRLQYARVVGSSAAPTAAKLTQASPKRSPKRIKFLAAAPKPQVVVSVPTITVDREVDVAIDVSAELMPPPAAPAAPAAPADHEEWDTEDTASVSDTMSISSGASSATSQGKKKHGPGLMTRMLKGKKLRRAKKRAPVVKLEPGCRIVVETLSTSSVADVVWQDGTVEEGIPSTQLYPIHHLDDQEFFPGDFVVENREDDNGSSMRVYGVVQSVDHLGRTAAVQWFQTYTSPQDPRPALLEETEVSVYDMKDHPDFQYRPGTVVIRVANFEGEDAGCTAGQVMDNYPKGMVRVWWVDGHVSMSWPQDLYKVGEYDSDEGELWDDGSSDASWETESEECFIPEDDFHPFYDDEQEREKIKPKLGANIEKARIAMSRLEEIFMQNPTLQTTAVMRQLLEVYKDCRYLDKLMGTSFFHETHFQGLLERVRERGRANTAQRVADQVNRLFYREDGMPAAGVDNGGAADDGGEAVPPLGKAASDAALNAAHSTRNNAVSDELDSTLNGLDPTLNAYDSTTFSDVISNVAQLERKLKTAVNNNRNAAHDLDDKVVTSAAVKVKGDGGGGGGGGATKVKGQQGEGGKGAKHGGTKHVAATADVTQNGNGLDPSQASLTSLSGNANSQVCAKLCALIKGQLVQAHAEVTRRFGGNQAAMTLSGAVNSGSGSSQRSGDGDTDGDGTTSEASGSEGVLSALKDSVGCFLSRFSPATPAATPCPQETDEQQTDDATETDRDKATPTPTPAGAEAGAEEGAAKKEAEEEEEVGEVDAEDNEEGFSIADCAPDSHKFKLTIFQPVEPGAFFKAVRKELRLLKTSLPPGIWVKGFEDRMDLYSVMIRGPEKTPYEDGLFFFDFQLSADYPRAPPLCHYVSYCSDRLNPNLYEDGKVCVSLLGTWSGKGTEVWTQHSTLLQVIISIQGLILVSEPYFNEAGYEKQKGSQSGGENSRMYNEMAVLKLVQSLSKTLVNPPAVFREEMLSHFARNAHKFLHRLDSWLDVSEQYNASHPVTPTTPGTFREKHTTIGDVQLPEFPLIPASKGFCLTLRKTVSTFRDVLTSVGIHESSAAAATTAAAAATPS